jgi:hypothetical protein
MSMQTAKVFMPRPVAVPRGARWASGLVVGLLRIGRQALQRLDRTAPAPVWRDPLGLPVQPPRPHDRAREAARVRAFATTVRQTDPRFADDLFAAADRHEVEPR